MKYIKCSILKKETLPNNLLMLIFLGDNFKISTKYVATTQDTLGIENNIVISKIMSKRFENNKIQ